MFIAQKPISLSVKIGGAIFSADLGGSSFYLNDINV